LQYTVQYQDKGKYMYYRLQADLSLDSGYVQKEDNQHEPLMNGAIVDENELILPWPFTVKPPEEGLKMSDYYPGAKIMSNRLVSILQSLGVDNLQTFPAVIKNKQTDELINNFLVINVIGMVSCANVAASESTPLADVNFFNKLVIDPKRARGLFMFRLAESRMDIIVIDKIAKAINDGNFKDIVLEPLEEKYN
jgi:hypothetical protein